MTSRHRVLCLLHVRVRMHLLLVRNTDSALQHSKHGRPVVLCVLRYCFCVYQICCVCPDEGDMRTLVPRPAVQMRRATVL